MRHQLPDPALWETAYMAGRVALAFDQPQARIEPTQPQRALMTDAPSCCCPEPAPFVPVEDPDDRPYLWDLDE